MELVYLWVEDYKNIKKQGFNFSPRFECSFDGETLTIDEKKEDEYVKDFFGDNINVTAIVGENGSGKSSIVNLFESNFTHTKIIYKLGDKFYTNFDVKKESKQKYNIEFLYSLEDFYDKNINNKSLHCNDSEPDNCKLLTIAEVLESDGSSFRFLNKDFTFTLWNINLQTNLPPLNTGIKELDEKYGNSILNKKNNNYLEIFVFVSIQFIQYILAKRPLKESRYWKSLNALANDFTKENYLILVNSIDLERFKELDKGGLSNYSLILSTLQKYDESIEYFEQFLKKQEISGTNIKDFIESGIYKTFYGFSNNKFRYSIINIEYFTEKGLKYSDLSSGEQQRIVNSALLIQNIMDEESSCKYHLSILDEPDMYLHPNWQKQLINDLITVSKKYVGKSIDSIHLIITSHSPFVISDLPKENIIFLKNGEQVKGIKKKQTFGANIHTLLSDSFFMEDGLMGEFAKSKINEIINFYKKVEEEGKTDKNIQFYNKNQKKFWQTQSIVGEPYLKQILENHLIEIEKILLGKNGAKESKKERLLAQLRELDND